MADEGSGTVRTPQRRLKIAAVAVTGLLAASMWVLPGGNDAPATGARLQPPASGTVTVTFTAATATVTGTVTLTGTAMVPATATGTGTPTVTATVTVDATATATLTGTPTVIVTATGDATATATADPTGTGTVTGTATVPATAAGTGTPTVIGTATVDSTATGTVIATATVDATATPTGTGRPPHAEPPSIVLPYAARHAIDPRSDPVVRRVVARTMAMRGAIDRWDWEGGVAMVGLMHAYEATGDPLILDHVAHWIDTRLAEGVPLDDPAWRSPDCAKVDWQDAGVRHPNHAAPAWATLMLVEHVPRDDYRAVIERAIAFLLGEACRLDGALAHRPGEVWDDTLAMSVPLLVRYGATTGRDDLVDAAVAEYLVHARYLQLGDPSKATEPGVEERLGLWYHGWSFRAADHMSAAHWARGNGWVALAGDELMTWLPPDHPRAADVRGVHEAQLAALARHQGASGLWHTVVDRPDFYLETSGSAAIAAALIRSPDPALRAAGHRARAAIFAKVAADGTVTDVSTGTGVAPSIDAYGRVPHDEIKPYGQGLFLIAATAGR